MSATLQQVRRRWRTVRLGLPTVLGLGKRGHFLPDRNAAAIVQPMAYPAVERVFEAAQDRFSAVLQAADAYRADLMAIGADAPPAPRWNQGWFPTLDAAVAYTLVRDRRPARIVEIGSGHSTRFMARAIADGGLNTHQVAIDPRPRAGIAGLPLDHIARPVQTVDPSVFAALAPDDILFIDSSHIAVAGSDVDVLINRVVPALPAGAMVHIHDMHLPDDYPASWAWRGYNEHSVVVPLVTGGGFAPVFASHYAATRMALAVGASVIDALPRVDGAPPGSLWLEKRTPA